jgi:hypothetical protein
MMDLERTAASAPAALVWQRGFWRANRRFALTVAGAAVLIVLLSPLTYPRSSDPAAWLAVLIHGLVIFGLATAVKSLAQTEVDDAIARLVCQRATLELGQIKGGLKDRIFLDRVESDLLPHNPSYDQGAIRIFQFILNEARDRKFHASFLAVEPLRGAGVGALFRMQTAQKIAVQLGILGTFAGLIVALARMGGGGDDLLGAGGLASLLDALHIAFSTSIAGLEVAIILGVGAILLRSRHEVFFANLDAASAAITALARNAINRDDFLVELEQVRAVMTQLGDRVHEQSREVAVQTEVIRTGLSRLAGVKGELDACLQEVRGEQAKVLTEMHSVYEVISPKRTAEELKEALTEVHRELADSFREQVGASFAGFEKLGVALRATVEIGGTMQRAVAGLGEIVGGMERLRPVLDASAAAAAGQGPTEGRFRVAPPVPVAAAPPPAIPAVADTLALARFERGLDRVSLHLESLSRELAKSRTARRERPAAVDLAAMKRQMNARLAELRSWWRWLREHCAAHWPASQAGAAAARRKRGETR